VVLAFVDDVSRQHCRDVIAERWQGDTDEDGNELCIVGYDAVISAQHSTLIFAGSYRPPRSSPNRKDFWQIIVIRSTSAYFWEFLAAGRMRRLSIEAVFRTRFFTRQLRRWAETEPDAAMKWIDSKPWLANKVPENHKNKARAIARAMRQRAAAAKQAPAARAAPGLSGTCR
jgi:hypothetical protein